jgi:UDP-N-acetylglucosamine/UDP-N-acetyl-alpha-D-glucosaminouronate 4-epimerase
MSNYEEVAAHLKQQPRKWLVTGVAGFIGSNLLEKLLLLDQQVLGLDNFATGKRENLAEVCSLVTTKQWRRFELSEGDIAEPAICRAACRGIDLVLHQAALGSVPLSMNEPLRCHASNVTGFVNLLAAAKEEKVQRIVYASSSAVYGDDPGLPKIEGKIGQPLSPYGASKLMDEIYAGVFARAFGQESIGLRYFNVFGRRQDPQGAYAAVIPKWIAALLRGEPVAINGDGETSRDFCFIENVVQANLLAATTPTREALGQVYNIGSGHKTTLNELFGILERILRARDPSLRPQPPQYRDFRPGDVRHSLADITKAQRLLGYSPTHGIEQGLQLAMQWYEESLVTR